MLKPIFTVKHLFTWMTLADVSGVLMSSVAALISATVGRRMVSEAAFP